MLFIRKCVYHPPKGGCFCGENVGLKIRVLWQTQVRMKEGIVLVLKKVAKGLLAKTER